MPAVTFMHSTIHKSQNCGVVMARSAVTLPVVTIARGGGAVQPAGRQPGRGMRTVNTGNTTPQFWLLWSVLCMNVTARASACSVRPRR